jgi:hypothetical protein
VRPRSPGCSCRGRASPARAEMEPPAVTGTGLCPWNSGTPSLGGSGGPAVTLYRTRLAAAAERTIASVARIMRESRVRMRGPVPRERHRLAWRRATPRGRPGGGSSPRIDLTPT